MLWPVIRVLLVAWAALSGSEIARWPYQKASFTFLSEYFAVMVLVGALVTVALLSITRLGLRAGSRWARPSWRTKPSFRNPVHIMHLLAWFAIGGGVSAIVCATRMADASLQGGVAIAGLGVGLLAGVHTAVRVFRQAFPDR